MKKLLTVFILMFVMCFATSHTADAQVQYYRTTAFASKQKDNNGTWSDWTDWQKSNMTATINLTDDVIKIYSPTIQIYHVTELVSKNENSYYYEMEAVFRVYDQDGDKGTLRLIIDKEKNSYIYIEFGNIMWRYRVLRTDTK